jgi:hypothetical protein
MAVRSKGKKIAINQSDAISFVDLETKHAVHIGRYDFEKEMLKVHNKISRILSRVEKLGKYKLDEIELSVGVSGGIITLTVEGGISLRYKVM